MIFLASKVLLTRLHETIHPFLDPYVYKVFGKASIPRSEKVLSLASMAWSGPLPPRGEDRNEGSEV